LEKKKIKFIFHFFVTVSRILFDLGSRQGGLNNVESTLSRPGANPIKIIAPTPKFWSWLNYKKSLFQSYKAVLCIENWHRLHQKMTLLLPEMFYRIGSRGGQPFCASLPNSR
jgi:hypothetical protein